MHEGARLVRAGHDAITAANADMFVHQHNAVSTFERGAGRAHIDTGRFGTVLAHHGQGLGLAGAQFLDFYFADPLGIGGLGAPREPVLSVTRGDAIRAATGALGAIKPRRPDFVSPASLDGELGTGIMA